MKHVSKRLLALVLGAMLILTSLVPAASALEVLSGVEGNMYWEFANGKMTIAPANAEPQTDSAFIEIADQVREIEFLDGVESVNCPSLILFTNVQTVTIPKTMNFDLVSPAEDEEDIAEIISEFASFISDDLSIEKGTALYDLAYAAVETIGYESAGLLFSLPLTADEYRVDPENVAFCAKDGKLFTKDGKVLLRQAAGTASVTLGLDPFVDPLALVGLDAADVEITDAYAQSIFGSKEMMKALIRKLWEQIDTPEVAAQYEEADESEASEAMENPLEMLRELVNDLIPAVDEIMDVLLTLELSLFPAKSFSVSDSNEYLCTVDGVLYSKDMTALIKYPVASENKSYTIPESVEKYSIPFMTVDLEEAVQCAFIYIGQGTGLNDLFDPESASLTDTFKERLKKVVYLPAIDLYMQGRQLDLYFNGSSMLEEILHKYVGKMLNLMLTDSEMEEQLNIEIGATISFALKVALSLVKSIGVSKIILDKIPDLYLTDITMYNALMAALHNVADVCKAIVSGDKRETGKAISQFLSADFFVEILGKDNVTGLCAMVQALFDGDFDAFYAQLPVIPDILKTLLHIADKLIPDENAEQTQMAEKALDAIAVFVQNPTYSEWVTLIDTILSLGIIPNESYAEMVTEESYIASMENLLDAVRTAFDNACEEIDLLFEMLTDPENQEVLMMVSVVADLVQTVIGLFPEQIIEIPHVHVPGLTLVENEIAATCTAGGSYEQVIYCTDCGDELSRTIVTTNALGHDFSSWTASGNQHVRTCRRNGCGVTESQTHNFKDYSYNNDATIDKDGTETGKCTVCGATDTRDSKGTKLPRPVISIRDYVANRREDYHATIQFAAIIQNEIPGGEIHWFVNGQDVGNGSEYKKERAESSFTVQAKYVKDNKSIAESEIETVSIRNSLFWRIIAFIRDIFKKAPVIIQAYVGAEIREG